jgi:hypothetical protein
LFYQFTGRRQFLFFILYFYYSDYLLALQGVDSLKGIAAARRGGKSHMPGPQIIGVNRQADVSQTRELSRSNRWRASWGKSAGNKG